VQRKRFLGFASPTDGDTLTGWLIATSSFIKRIADAKHGACTTAVNECCFYNVYVSIVFIKKQA
ncbi:MAG: hypothetical protein RR816_09535, partial [Clostridia bacterium]